MPIKNHSMAIHPLVIRKGTGVYTVRWPKTGARIHAVSSRVEAMKAAVAVLGLCRAVKAAA